VGWRRSNEAERQGLHLKGGICRAAIAAARPIGRLNPGLACENQKDISKRLESLQFLDFNGFTTRIRDTMIAGRAESLNGMMK